VHFGEEECDDGNLVNGDGCDSACKEEVVCAIARINIAFVIDTSGSMRWDDRLKAAKAAVTKFVEYMDFPKDRAAVISFGDTATIRQALTTVESDLKSAVNNLQPAWGTNIQHGLSLAKAQLDAATSRVKIIILLTDGAPNRKNASSDLCTFAVPPNDDCGVIAEAALAKAAGMKVFSVGLGVDGATELLLKEVANDPDAVYYHFAPGAEEVLAVYGAISDAICPCSAGDLCDPAKGDADCASGFQCLAGKCRLTGQTGCDESDGNNYDECTNACFTPVCGDGIKSVGLGEQCDDGGTCSGGAYNGTLCTKVNEVTVCAGVSCVPVSGDGCSGGAPGCRVEPLCGNRIREGWESCDDGGTCVGGTKDGMACKKTWADPNVDCPNGGACTPQNGDGCSGSCSSEWSPSPSYCRIEGEPCFKDEDCNEPDTIVCGSCAGGNATTYNGQCDIPNGACVKRIAPVSGYCPVPLCCNNVKEGYEECDDGRRCNGASGAAAGNVCTSDAQCGAVGRCIGFNGDGCTGACALPQCSNGMDDADTEDVLVDIADPGCHTDGNASNPASYSPQDNDETDVISSGASKEPSICTTDGLGSAPWLSLANCQPSDNANTTYTGNGSMTSDRLYATGFNFVIPASATITGIQVEYEVSVEPFGHFNSIRLVKGGNLVGGDTGDQPNISPNGTDLIFTFGGSSDLWGTSWTPSDINNAGFGVAANIQANGSVPPLFNGEFRTDNIIIRVYYTAS
ncbi:MAG: VWA domain-containing protein, partial [Patescibacteria group bacterium]